MDELKVVARIYNDFPAKFGIPRQSGLVESLKGAIVLEPEYRNPDVYRGLEGFSHVWLLWGFSANKHDKWSPTVLPPRLGGKTHMGVFATRSPFRPNPIGLSSVKIDYIDWEAKEGPILHVLGADLMSGTPIYDIKPYLPYADCHMEARGGFADHVKDYSLEVIIPDDLLEQIPVELRETVYELLAQDPRPSYQNDPTRRYGVAFGGMDLRFHVKDGILTVCEVVKL